MYDLQTLSLESTHVLAEVVVKGDDMGDLIRLEFHFPDVTPAVFLFPITGGHHNLQLQEMGINPSKLFWK